MYLFWNPMRETLWVSMVRKESDERLVCPIANSEINRVRKNTSFILFRLNINNEAKVVGTKAFGNTYKVVF
jgi:hypothetical protein